MRTHGSKDSEYREVWGVRHIRLPQSLRECLSGGALGGPASQSMCSRPDLGDWAHWPGLGICCATCPTARIMGHRVGAVKVLKERCSPVCGRGASIKGIPWNIGPYDSRTGSRAPIPSQD
jgi:hypothetical protein